ncbi:hypothetical protein [Paraburkholderia rhynchosiae]|uniref:Alpha 1,4-glycosyltransferase domain-containing protein n=1 Tax=Paraburkholderia rhynchosiae TaxID=487049 RepID=A0A2N7WST6_9BURK|nr:hypothetical protein [Paraburkholderia rhynchosiae]PMS32335.1 hypothetical protein C0Z16_06905 [Paraburkholderia rhynchosiae]CAB3731813.1 hypothetical protein LMG27174_05868 [Paraburkholderia rhynchosiae]
MSNASFASFWHGPELSAYEVACLSSFTTYGSDVALYCYSEVKNLPKGVIAKDASAIVSPDALTAFSIDGVPSMAHFTDYFRFVMFTKTEEIWVDTDMLLLRDFDRSVNGNIIGRESATSICTALLRLDPADHRLLDLLLRIEAMKGTNIKWGDTGPRLLTAVYGVKAGMPESEFYPIHFDDYYKVFLPQHFDECATRCANSYALHLWNNRVVKMGLFKRIGPPVGSFLHHVFERIGANSLFQDFYPANVMQAMIDNAVQKVGRDEGFRKLLQIGVPVVKTAIVKRLGV